MVTRELAAKYGVRFCMIGRDPYIFGTRRADALRDRVVTQKELLAAVRVDDLIARAQRSARLQVPVPKWKVTRSDA